MGWESISITVCGRDRQGKKREWDAMGCNRMQLPKPVLMFISVGNPVIHIFCGHQWPVTSLNQRPEKRLRKKDFFNIISEINRTSLQRDYSRDKRYRGRWTHQTRQHEDHETGKHKRKERWGKREGSWGTGMRKEQNERQRYKKRRNIMRGERASLLLCLRIATHYQSVLIARQPVYVLLRGWDEMRGREWKREHSCKRSKKEKRDKRERESQ